MQTHTKRSLKSSNCIAPKLTKIFIFTALECEAKPLISLFKLKRTDSQEFSIYTHQDISLTVTGVGKNSMAAGVAFTLATLAYTASPILINLGIAGHKTEMIGNIVLADKISDSDSLRTFYPQFIGINWPTTCPIKTFSAPTTQYSDHHLNDMEASAFYEIATKFSSSELIHCIKIISDNQHSSIKNINAKNVATWIDSNTTSIQSLIDHLRLLQKTTMAIKFDNYNKIINTWHFTTTGKIKLKFLLLQWKVLSTDHWDICDIEGIHTGKDLLKKLEYAISQVDVIL